MIGRTSMPGWRMSTSRNEMPLCFGASGSVRASVKMWSARWPADVQIFWPLSTHWSPSSVGPQRQAAEVGPGVGLGVALAPAVLAGQDARQVVPLLLLGAPHEQRVAEHLDAEHVVGPAGRHAGLGELLGDDHLLERRQPAAAVLDRPARARGTRPRTARRATTRRTRRPRRPRAVPMPPQSPGQLLGEERLHLLAVGLGLGPYVGFISRTVPTRTGAGSHRASAAAPTSGASLPSA